jgi:hypothetical protein
MQERGAGKARGEGRRSHGGNTQPGTDDSTESYQRSAVSYQQKQELIEIWSLTIELLYY